MEMLITQALNDGEKEQQQMGGEKYRACSSFWSDGSILGLVVTCVSRQLRTCVERALSSMELVWSFIGFGNDTADPDGRDAQAFFVQGTIRATDVLVGLGIPQLILIPTHQADREAGEL